ncbi:hypothetical protein ACJJTC_001267 [Scirpophaga incertulas]
MTPSKLDPNVRKALTRFIHTGNQSPKYYPGCWTSHKYYELTQDRLVSLNNMFPNGLGDVEVVNIILKAYKDGWYTRFETIAYALCKCLLLGTGPVKEATYKAASEICHSSEQMMLFNRFTRLLHTGNGRGWCKHVKQWYVEKDPMELAKEVCKVKARHGRSHKTIIRKSHLKLEATDYARDAVIKYAVLGLKRAKQLLGDKPEAKPIFEYIQKVEDLRHCEDPAAGALLAGANNFSLDHIPGHLLTSQDVWNAIMPEFNLEQLLHNIQRIHNMGFLTSESTTTAILVSLLNNQDVIKKSKVTPLLVYITLCNYKKKGRPMKHEKAKVTAEKELRRRSRQMFNVTTGLWEWIVTRRHPKEVKHWGIDQPPNPAVIAALSNLIDQTWLLTRPTKKRYMITLDMRHHMFKGRHFCKSYVVPKKGKKAVAAKAPVQPTAGGDADAEKKSKKHLFAECFYNKNVTPGHAAIILALQLLKREKKVKLAVFSEEGVQIISIERNFSNIEEAEFVFRKANLGRVQLDAPIEWAMKNNHKVDVFINMVDRTTRFMELDISARGGRGPGGRYGPPPKPSSELVDHCPVRALQRYRAKHVSEAKLIVVSLASHRVGTTDGTHEGVLDIVGIDEHVPKVMDAFALGQFK